MIESEIKKKFADFLIGNVERETTVKQYVSKLSILGKWFIDNEIAPINFNIWLDTKDIDTINNKLKTKYKELWLSTNKREKNWLSSPWNKWIDFNNNHQLDFISVEMEDFIYTKFYESAIESNLFFSKSLVLRFISTLITKPFVILTGLSGSGKTKLAQAFAMWICENENQYCIVPVGADWTNREPLLGFPNALKSGEYVKPDNRVLDLIIEATKLENQHKPYFLILDEMNLSHVERYFADFLSVMESHKKISLHTGTENWGDVPSEINLPSNLFIVGTVNIDETTYMFSPKVLDRASVIEFRVTENEMKNYLRNKKSLNLKPLEATGVTMASGFVEIANNETIEPENAIDLNNALIDFFSELKKTGAEFGFRSASEILRFAGVINKIERANWTLPQIIDAAIMQKLLPKVHGSRRKLEPVLKTLGTLCLIDGQNMDDFISAKTEINFADATKIKYPLSLEKILRMYQSLISNGFTSYAEA